MGVLAVTRNELAAMAREHARAILQSMRGTREGEYSHYCFVWVSMRGDAMMNEGARCGEEREGRVSSGTSSICLRAACCVLRAAFPALVLRASRRCVPCVPCLLVLTFSCMYHSSHPSLFHAPLTSLHAI